MGKNDSNIYPDADKIRERVRQLDDLYEEIASVRGAAMQTCKALREQINDVYDAVNNDGMNKRAFRAAYRRKELRSKIEGEKVSLDSPELIDELEKLEQALSAWEATPLGGAKKAAA